MKRKKKQPEQSVRPGPQKPKMSEMISEFAGDFIRLGKTPEEKQNYLNGACVAWNVASAPPERRKKLLDHLIEAKLKMFPHDLRQIVSATYIRTKEGDRIEVASARL